MYITESYKQSHLFFVVEKPIVKGLGNVIFLMLLPCYIIRVSKRLLNPQQTSFSLLEYLSSFSIEDVDGLHNGSDLQS